MRPPVSREDLHELVFRVGTYVPGVVTGWLVSNTALPPWVAEEVASWATVGIILAVLIVEHRLVEHLQDRYDD